LVALRPRALGVVSGSDSDGDGVPDASDQCPTQPASTPTGCPPIQPAPDADGDGVPDGTDPEPNNPNVPGAFGATNNDDTLTGDANLNTICGLLGNDTINGMAGNDTLFGDACGATAKRLFGA
jgi:Ca2+-binding RTX toxin-like protein